jgi:hypothetical protein
VIEIIEELNHGYLKLPNPIDYDDVLKCLQLYKDTFDDDYWSEVAIRLNAISCLEV